MRSAIIVSVAVIFSLFYIIELTLAERQYPGRDPRKTVGRLSTRGQALRFAAILVSVGALLGFAYALEALEVYWKLLTLVFGATTIWFLVKVLRLERIYTTKH